MTSYVIDASVAVKWVLAERLQSEAFHYLNPDFRLLAPSFILIECISAIQKKVWRKEIRSEDGWYAYEILRRYDRLILTSTHDLLRPSFELANTISHSIYDCFYLALAIQENALVVTADYKFFECAKRSPYANYISLIENPRDTEL